MNRLTVIVCDKNSSETMSKSFLLSDKTSKNQIAFDKERVIAEINEYLKSVPFFKYFCDTDIDGELSQEERDFEQYLTILL